MTAARLAQDQADIDTAQAKLGEARAQGGWRRCGRRTPDGCSRSGLARGDQVSSSDTAAVLVGQGVTTVTASVSSAQVLT